MAMSAEWKSYASREDVSPAKNGTREKRNGRSLLSKRPSKTVLDRKWRLAAVGRLVVLRRLAAGLVSRGFLLLLALLLLLLLQPLLFLPVFLFKLLELLLLFLLDLLPSSVHSICLLSPLLLLNLSLVDLLGLLGLLLLSLLDLLALLVLFQAQLVQLLLMPLIELRVHRGIRIPAVGPSASRAIVIGLFAAVVCGRIPRLIALRLLSGVIGGRWPV